MFSQPHLSPVKVLAPNETKSAELYVQLSCHNQSRLVGINSAALVKKVDGDIICIQENETLPKDMYIHDVTYSPTQS